MDPPEAARAKGTLNDEIAQAIYAPRPFDELWLQRPLLLEDLHFGFDAKGAFIGAPFAGGRRLGRYRSPVVIAMREI